MYMRFKVLRVDQTGGRCGPRGNVVVVYHPISPIEILLTVTQAQFQTTKECRAISHLSQEKGVAPHEKPSIEKLKATNTFPTFTGKDEDLGSAFCLGRRDYSGRQHPYSEKIPFCKF